MKFNNRDEQLTAYALGELEEKDAAEVEALLEHDEQARRYVEEIRGIGELAEEAFAAESLGEERHDAILAHTNITTKGRDFWLKPSRTRLAVLAASAIFVAGLAYVSVGIIGDRGYPFALTGAVEQIAADDAFVQEQQLRRRASTHGVGTTEEYTEELQQRTREESRELAAAAAVEMNEQLEAMEATGYLGSESETPTAGTRQYSNLQNVQVGGEIRIRANDFAPSDVKDNAANAPTAGRGQAAGESAPPPQITRGRAPIPGQLQFGTDYFDPQGGRAAGGIEPQLPGLSAGGGGFGGGRGGSATGAVLGVELQITDSLDSSLQTASIDSFAILPPQLQVAEPNTEAYDRVVDNPFKRVMDEPLSTFSIDVDTGSYANVRRFLRNNQLPPKDAVRIEELLNYFQYAYAPPVNDDPFAAHVELVECPWNDQHQLMRIGLKGREVEVHTRPAANLVFLLDVSGSMEPANKLPLVRGAMQLLTKQLRPDDRVAIVTYAGASGLVLPSTPGTDQATILSAIGRLNSGGSTNGASGIELAYQVAQEHFFDGGVNRVILATDGDFNVGTTDRGSLERLIEEKAKSGVFLTVLGVGEGNLKDAMMEQLADKGNGQYAYLDSEREARKVLVDQVGGTLVTIAKDVKIQIDFNPAQVGAYRLIGYENRVLAAQDFDDDTKDAGEIGAGHTVTALYEIVPPGVALDVASGTQSRYQVAAAPQVDTHSNELLTVKLRHKEPDGDTSTLLEIPIATEVKTLADASQDSRFAAAVAAFGMALRESPHRGSTDWDLIANLAEDGLGDDPQGYRAEFMEMIQVARRLKPAIELARQTSTNEPPALELVRITPWTGGTYVAEICTQADRPKRFGVGDQFGVYQIISIDPGVGEVVVYSEEHRKNFTLSTTN